MELRDILAVASIVGTVLVVPLGTAFWAVQKRLSRIEGILEVVLRNVR